MSNKTVLNRLNVKDRLIKIIQCKKLKYFGHIIRHDDTLQRTVLDGRVNGKRGRGRPRTKWTTNIEKWTGMGYHQAVRRTHDRKKCGEPLHPTLIKRTEQDDDGNSI